MTAVVAIASRTVASPSDATFVISASASPSASATASASSSTAGDGALIALLAVPLVLVVFLYVAFPFLLPATYWYSFITDIFLIFR